MEHLLLIAQWMSVAPKYRYRFPEPMMQLFILMIGIANQKITGQQISDLAAITMRRGFPASFSQRCRRSRRCLFAVEMNILLLGRSIEAD
jgi:hypothetical protein